ncbi:unnamed protein product, partial [Amoebophrya sp. A120]|eukprot:GSA120T00016144001.1
MWRRTWRRSIIAFPTGSSSSAIRCASSNSNQPTQRGSALQRANPRSWKRTGRRWISERGFFFDSSAIYFQCENKESQSLITVDSKGKIK